jgi:type II secretory pathway pseudopilin PulG
MQRKFLPHPTYQSQQGFTLLETMMGAMISLLFLSLGANLVLAANLQKVVAKRNIQMNTLIQSDLETVKYQANTLPKDDTMCPKTIGTNMIKGYGAALQANLRDKLGSDIITTDVKIGNTNYQMKRTIDITQSGNANPSVLPVYYQFARKDDAKSKTEYELYIEIIPNAAFTCPSA